VICILALTVSNSIPLKSVAASSAVLVIGNAINPPPPTFYENGVNNLIGSAQTEIPYLDLFGLSLNGTAVPGICGLPTVVPGTNSTQWIVNLRSPDMKWSDGEPITSTDLAYSFGIYMTTGPYANLAVDPFGAMTQTSVDIVNSSAIKVTFPAPDPLFPILTFLYSLYPYHYYMQFTGANAVTSATILSGPGDSSYIPSNYTAGSRTMTLVPNSNYPFWNGMQPGLSAVTLQYFSSESALVSALAAGTVDAADITPSDAASLSTVPGLSIQPVISTLQLFTYLNNTVYPWNINTFRQAIMTLLPKQQINDALYNGTAAIGNPLALIPQAKPNFWPGPETPTYDYNPTQATSLLQASGLIRDSSGHWAMSNGTEIVVDFESDNTDPNEIRAAQMVQTAMQNVGLLVNLRLVDAATASNDWATFNYKLLMFENNYAPTPYRYLRNPLNTARFARSNSTFIGLRVTAANDLDPARSLQELKQAELYFAQSAIIDPILVLPQYVAIDQEFSGWQPALNNVGFYNSLSTAGEQVFQQYVLAQVYSSPSTSTSTMASTSIAQAAPGTDYTYVGAAVLVIVVIAVIVAYSRRKKKS